MLRHFSLNSVRRTAFVLLVVLVGCGSSGRMDEDAARRALETTLTAWKSGSSPSSLEQQSPKIIASDFDWRAGKTLVDFKIPDGGTRQGTNLRSSADLTLRSGSGPTTRVSAVYLITTHPVTTVVRQENE